MRVKGCVAVLCAVSLVGTAVPSRGESPLDTGVQQAQEGDYPTAVVTLRGVVERLASNPQAKADLKTAYVYLGVAHLGLNQESDARRAFVSALKIDPALQVTTTDFPPRVVRFFERIHQEAVASGEVRRPPTAAAKKSGGGKGLLFIAGGAVVAGGAGAVLLGKKKENAPANSPPSPGTISVTPEGAGISAATQFTFSANSAGDPDGDPLTYNWDLGDATRDQGPTVKHIYAGTSPPGAPFTVIVTVSDGKSQATAPPAQVMVKSLNGTWVGMQGNIQRVWNIVQSGTQITGSYTSSACPNAQGSLLGSVGHPRNVHIEASIGCWPMFVFDGEADPQVNNLSGTGGGAPLTFQRQ